MFSLCIYLLLNLVTSTESQGVEIQPFCPDMKPPFTSQQVYRLCLYRKYGCCTDGEDFFLLNKYIEIRDELKRRNLGRECNGMIVDLLCENCSPISGQLFNNGYSIPRVCTESCESIYNRCALQIRIAVQLTTNDSSTLASLESVESFCNSMAPASGFSDLCFPQSELIALDIEENPAVTETSCVCLEKYAEDLRNPVIFRNAGDGSQRVYIGEQIGLIYTFLANGTRQAKPFLDISDRVFVTRFPYDERGLLGLEFHPGFFFNDKFYVYYCARTEQNKDVCILSEFLVHLLERDVADLDSERVLLEIEQPYANHNGGELLFGEDGYLYVFLGDGGAGGDPRNFSQNRKSFLGKVLRIDVNSQEDGKPYAIPPDNPYVNDTNFLPEIYAFGIRNIWRCGKDAGDRDTGEGRGRIVCGDVGQGRFEELDLLVKGGNYGWRGREGFECFDLSQCNQTEPEVLPIHVYDHSVGQSITGGKFYRGCNNPNLDGYYLFGDYVNGRMFKIKESTPGSWVTNNLPLCPANKCTNGLLSQKETFLLSFGEDEKGEVYILVTDNSSSRNPGGKVYKLVDPMRRGNPESCDPAPLPSVQIPRIDPGARNRG